MHILARLVAAAVPLLLCGATPPEHAPLAATPISRMDLSWWRTRHAEKLKELHGGRVDLIFLGDSITEDYELSGPPEWRNFLPVWQRFYGDRHAVNLGFSGDATSHLLWRIENGEVADIAPKVAVILIGANNLGRLHWPAGDTVAGIDAIVTQLHRRLPQTQLVLLGVLPSDRSAWVNEATLAINKALAARYQRTADVIYLNIGEVFMKGGTINRELYFDPKLSPPASPLHPTAEGQLLMAEAIEPTLAALLGDRPHLAAR
jgi:lysophospholipase L1-like esterase